MTNNDDNNNTNFYERNSSDRQSALGFSGWHNTPITPPEKPDTLTLEYPALSQQINSALAQGWDRNTLRRFLAQREALALTQYSPAEVNQFLGRDDKSIERAIEAINEQKDKGYAEIMKYDMSEDKVRDILKTAGLSGIAPGVLLFNPDLLPYAEQIAGKREDTIGYIVAGARNFLANLNSGQANRNAFRAADIKPRLQDDNELLQEGLSVLQSYGIRPDSFHVLGEDFNEDKIREIGRKSLQSRLTYFEQSAKTDAEDAQSWFVHVRPPDSTIGKFLLSAAENFGFTAEALGNTLLGWGVSGAAGGVVAAIVNSIQESDTEAGQTFVESMRRGRSFDESLKAAKEVRLKNMLYLPASNYGADYMFYKGVEYLTLRISKFLPGTGLLSTFARWALPRTIAFVTDNLNEGIEEWNQELFQIMALGDEYDKNRLNDAFTMGVADAAIYSIIGGLLRKGINAAGARVSAITPQGKARAEQQKIFNQFLTGVRDLYNLQQDIQQGKVSLDDTVQQIPVVFLPRSKLDDNTANALGIQQEFIEDDSWDTVLDFNGIDNTEAAAWQDIEGLGLQDEQDEQVSSNEENLDEEVAVRKELWDKFKADHPQEATALADFVRDGSQGITAREQLQELQQNISQIASENEAVAQEIPKLTQRLVDAGVNQQEAANIANIAGAVANSLNKRYGIDVAQSMNIVTSPESTPQMEGYNQATVANRDGIFNGFRLPFNPSELHTPSGSPILQAGKDEMILTPDGSDTLGRIPFILDDDTTFAQGEISANAGAIQLSEKIHGSDIRHFHYDDALTMLLDVLNNWTEIYRGDGNALILAAHRDNLHSVKSVVYLVENSKGKYVVKDVGPVKNRYLNNKTLLYTRSIPYVSESDPGLAYPKGGYYGQNAPQSYARQQSNSHSIDRQRETYNQDDRRSGARKFLDIINDSLREITEKDHVSPQDAILDTKQVMQKARELGISEQNIDAFMKKLSELGFLKMYIQRDRDHSTGEVRKEKAGYRVKAYDALRFYNSSRQQIIDTIREELRAVKRDYQRYIAIPFLDTTLGLLDFDGRFWIPDDPQFADLVKRINNLDFEGWADIKKVLDKLSKKQIAILARQMGFYINDVNAKYNTRRDVIGSFESQIIERAHSRYQGEIGYLSHLGLENPSTHLVEVLDKLQKQIDFLHSLENDYEDNLYHTPPAPPPPPVDYTVGRIGSFKIGKNEYSVFPYQYPKEYEQFNRLYGSMFDIRDSSNGQLIGRYSPALDTLDTLNRSIAFEEKLNKSFRKNLQAFLKAAGLLDENGQLISDGNEQLRQHFRDWMAEDKTRLAQDFPFQQFEEQQDNQLQQDNQTQQDNTAQTLNGELDVGELVFPYRSKTYKFKVVATDSTRYDNEGMGDSIYATRLRRYNGRRLEVRTTRGKVVHSYYPYQDGAEWWGEAVDNRKKYTPRWKDTYDRNFQAHLQEYLRQGGFLDEQGNLKPDGNEEMRRRWDALEDSDKIKHDDMFYSNKAVFQEDALDDTQPLPQPQTVSQTQPASQATEKIATAQDFKAAFDEEQKFKTYPLTWDVRKRLGWPREVFDEMVRTLRDNGTIQLEQADESLYSREDILDAFVDKNGYKNGIMVWMGNSTPNVSIPYQAQGQAIPTIKQQAPANAPAVFNDPDVKTIAALFANDKQSVFNPQSLALEAQRLGLSKQQASKAINSLLSAGIIQLQFVPNNTEDYAFAVVRPDLLQGGLPLQATTSPQRQNSSTTQDTHGTATAQDFKAAFDELHKFREFPRIPDLRRKLGWPREVFDEMIRTFRDNLTIQLYTADESLFTKDELQNCFVSEKSNLIMGTLSWMDNRTPSVSIPFSATQNTPSQDNNIHNSNNYLQKKSSEILDTEDSYIPERTDKPRSDGVIDFNSLITVNQRSENEFRDAINTLHDILGGELVMPENMKSSELIKQEAAQYEDDYSRVVDVWSATINFDNQQDFSNAFDTLDSLPDVIRLLQSDNQAVANIRLEEGAVVELRINLSEQQHSSNDTLSETSTTQDIFKTEKGLPVSQSDSKDFLLSPEGNSILSVIDEQTANAAGIKPGGIRANVGALRHAESGHGKQITEAGYDSVQAFLLDVLNNWSQIWEGTKGSYLLVRPLQNKHNGVAAIQLQQAEENIYHVATLMYIRDRSLKNKKLLTAGRPSPATSSGSGSNLTRAALASSEKSAAKGDSSSEQLNSNSLAGQTESVNQQQDTQELSNDELEYLQSHNWDVDDLKARYSVPQIKETIAQKIRQQRISDTGELATLPKPIFSIPLGQKFADNIDVVVNSNFKGHPFSEHLALQASECTLYDLVYKHTDEPLERLEWHWAGAARILAYGRGILFADENGAVAAAYFPYVDKFYKWYLETYMLPGLNRFLIRDEIIGPDSDKAIRIQPSDIEKALQPILPDILRAGGFTDEQGNLKDDGNSAYREQISNLNVDIDDWVSFRPVFNTVQNRKIYSPMAHEALAQTSLQEQTIQDNSLEQPQDNNENITAQTQYIPMFDEPEFDERPLFDEGEFNNAVLDDVPEQHIPDVQPQGINSRASWPAGTSSAETATLVEFFNSANPSSGFHELAHHILRVLSDAAQLDNASDELIKDVNTIFKNAGVTSSAFFNNRDNARSVAHEYFADAFETYLSEGKAPTNNLQGTFDRIKAWLVDVYHNVIHSLGIQLNDEMRDIFDRLLASPEQLAQRKALEDITALYKAGEQELARLQQEIALLENEHANLQHELLSEQQQREFLQAQFDGASKALNDARQQLATLEQQAASNDETANAQAQLLRQNISQLELQVTDLQNQLDNEQSGRAQEQAKAAQLQNEFKRLEQELQDTEQNSLLWENTAENAYIQGKNRGEDYGIKEGRDYQKKIDRLKHKQQLERRLAKAREHFKNIQERQKERRRIRAKARKLIKGIHRMSTNKAIIWNRQEEIRNLLDTYDISKLGKLSLQDMQYLYYQVKKIYDTGRREMQAKQLADFERVEAIRQNLRDTLEKLIPEQTGAVRGRDDLSKDYSGVKGKIRKIIDWTMANTMGAQRFFDFLDDGHGHYNGAWVHAFVDNANDAYNTELRHKFTRIAAMEKTMQDLGITPKMLGQTRNVDVPHKGRQAWTVDELMSIYAGLKNERSRAAILFGNFKDAGDQAEAWAAKCIQALSDNEKALADAIIREYEINFNRINQALIDIYNQGMTHEDNYTPMRRLEYTSRDANSLNPDAGEQGLLSAQGTSGMGNVQKGFSQSRVDFNPLNQNPIDLGLVNIWHSQVEAQEHMAAFGQLIKDLRRVLLGRNEQHSKTIRQMLKEAHGQDAWNMVKRYFNILANNDMQNAFDTLDGVSNTLARNMSIAYLCGNFGTMLKQLNSFARVIPYAGPVNMINAIGQFMQNPQKFMEECYLLDPQLRNRKGDPFIREIQNTQDGFYQDVLKWGMEPIGWTDRAAATIAFKAVYDANIKHGLSEEQAVREAQRAVLLTQPATMIKDKPLIWQQHGLAKLAMMFSNDMAQTFGLSLYDLTQQIRSGEVPKALSNLVGLTLAASIIRLISQGTPDEPDDPQEWAKWIAAAFAEQEIGSIPLIGKEALTLWDAGRGYFNQHSAFIAPFAKLASGTRGLWDSNSKNDERAIFNLLEGSALLAPFPATALRRLWGMLNEAGKGEVLRALGAMVGTHLEDKKFMYRYTR